MGTQTRNIPTQTKNVNNLQTKLKTMNEVLLWNSTLTPFYA